MQPITPTTFSIQTDDDSTRINQMSITDHLAERRYGAVSNLMNQKAPLTPDDFSTICFQLPFLAQKAITLYPELAKNAPFDLLLALCRKSTRQNEVCYAIPSISAATPTTQDILIALIEAGACIAGREKLTGYTLLHHAIENGLEAAAEKLIEHGIDPLAKIPHTGITPLHLAAEDGWKFRNVIKQLVKNNEALCQVTPSKSTPLHFAAKAKCITAVGLLLEAGANRLALDDCGQTALDIALLMEANKPLLNRLETSDAKHAFSTMQVSKAIHYVSLGDTLTDEDILNSCVGNNTQCTHELISACPDIVKSFSDTLVVNLMNHWFSPEIVALCSDLIDLGIGITGKEPKEGLTALHIAAKRCSINLVKKLLAAGAAPSVQDNAGNTPLHYSAQHNDARPFWALMEYGANLYVENGRKVLPRDIAMYGRVPEWVKAYYLYPLSETCRTIIKAEAKQIANITPEELKTLITKACSKAYFVQACCTESSTPLEVALLVHFDSANILTQMTDQQKIEGLQLIWKKHNHSVLHKAVLNNFFTTDPRHLYIKSVMSTAPPDIERQDFDIFLNRFNQNKALTNNNSKLSRDEITAQVSKFLEYVANKIPFQGTPKKDSPALKEYYKTIQNALSHLATYLASKPEEETQHQTYDICHKLAQASTLCGAQFFATPIELYNTYCLNVNPSLDSAFLEQFQILRGILVENMLTEPYVNKNQSVHALHYIKRILGEKLQLADRQAYQMEDPFEENGFTGYKLPSLETLENSFTKLYTQVVLCEYIFDLMKDDRYRTFYIDWAQKHLKTHAPGYQEYKTKKSLLKKNLEALSELEIERKGEVNSWLFDEATFTANRLPLILTLLKLGIIKLN